MKDFQMEERDDDKSDDKKKDSKVYLALDLALYANQSSGLTRMLFQTTIFESPYISRPVTPPDALGL